jgi:hypothetical protein
VASGINEVVEGRAADRPDGIRQRLQERNEKEKQSS